MRRASGRRGHLAPPHPSGRLGPGVDGRGRGEHERDDGERREARRAAGARRGRPDPDGAHGAQVRAAGGDRHRVPDEDLRDVGARSADPAVQPAFLRRPATLGGGLRAPASHDARVADDGPRSFQADQRRPRAPGRRPRAHGGLCAPVRAGPLGGRPGPLRGRGVRGARARHPVAGRGRARRAHADGDRGAAHRGVLSAARRDDQHRSGDGAGRRRPARAGTGWRGGPALVSGEGSRSPPDLRGVGRASGGGPAAMPA